MRVLLIFFLSLTLFVSPFPQAAFGQVWVGVRGGFGQSNALFQPRVGLNFTPYNGTNFGLVVRQSGSKFVGLQGEVNFAQKGWRQAFVDPGENPGPIRYADYRYNYAEIPFMTHIYIGNQFRYFLNVGPHIGILLSVDSAFSTDPRTDTVEYRYTEQAAIPFEYGITGGTGFSIEWGKSTIALEIRTAVGLNNFIDRNLIGSPTSAQHIAYHASFTYLYRLTGSAAKKKKPKKEGGT